MTQPGSPAEGVPVWARCRRAAGWAAAHRKALVALAAALLVCANALLPGNRWVALGISAATVLGVHLVPNRRRGV